MFEEKLPRLHVPEDRQPHEEHGDDPQNDVFTAVLFFCHRRSTAYLMIWFKCRADFPLQLEHQGFADAAVAPTRL
jgi:hypothetical protein